MWTRWRKERKEEVGSLKTLPLFVSRNIQQRLPRLWKPFFYWVSLLLQTLAENRVSAFLYPLLLPQLASWIGELYIGSKKCNNITVPIEQSQSSKSLRFFPNWNFLLFFSASPFQDYKLWFFSLFENRAISNLGARACRTIVNSNWVGLIASSDDFQSSLHTPVTIVSSSVDEWLGSIQPDKPTLPPASRSRAGWTDLTT